MSRPVAIVTAASRGIGAACARELSRRGYDLALMAQEDDIHALACELWAVAVTGTVASESDLRGLVETALGQYGRIDAVVTNTGDAPKGDLLDLTDDDWHAGLDLLLLNVVRVARLVTPSMLARQVGSIVNVSAFGPVEPSLKFPVSSCVRAALGAYAKLYCQRYAWAGLRMNNVLPGFIDPHPADEVARVVGFLASDESSYVTGRNFIVDGGPVRSA